MGPDLMHILFLSDNFPPEVNAPASRTYEHCREWVKLGHRVTVVTCAPNFPNGKVFAGYRNKVWQSEHVDGIRVIRVWSYITRNEGFFRRILDYLSYMITGSIAGLFVRRVDIIVGTSPQFFTACAAWLLSLAKRRPWIFELRDIWPESIRAVSAVSDSRVLALMEKVELALYRSATMIVAVTNAFRRDLIRRGIDPDKIHVVTNGVDTGRFRPMPVDATLREKLGLTGNFVAGYIGTYGLAHGLETVVDAAALLRDDPECENTRILMLGDGAEREALLERARARGAENIVFAPTVSREEVHRYWSLLDASIVHLRKRDLFKTVIPSKIFESMAMRTPVLLGVEGEAAELVIRNDAGLTFEPENPQDLVAKIKRLRADPALRERLATNGSRAAKAYDRRELARRMLTLIEGIVRRAGGPVGTDRVPRDELARADSPRSGS